MTRTEQQWLALHERLVARDAEGAAACFTQAGIWQNVPLPPAVGRPAITAMLAPILRRSERVRWDIVSASYTDTKCWLERVDRFWIDGEEYAVECNGVIDLDPVSGLFTSWRDYVDIGTWRARLAQAGPLT
jgi:limonene-1,2-epoxide hydrolase